MISLSGEGRGHATRIRAVLEALRGEHSFSVYTSGEALDFLGRLYRGNDVRVRRIPALRLERDVAGRACYGRSLRPTLRYLLGFPGLVSFLEHEIERDRPDLLISDFEPALPRAARRRDVPFLSLNHQNFLLTYDLSGLPRWLRWHAAYMGLVVRAYHQGQVASIVSSFYFPPLRPRFRNVSQVGVLLRSAVSAANPSDRGHLTAYFRQHVDPVVITALHALRRPVRVYGLGARPAVGQVQFRRVDEAGFLEDLATGDALISTAGNQLVGEALYLGKPVFALPEPGQYEQYMNAHFLSAGGAGVWSEMHHVTEHRLKRFLSALDRHRACIDRTRLNGLPETLSVIQRWLPASPLDPQSPNRSSGRRPEQPHA